MGDVVQDGVSHIDECSAVSVVHGGRWLAVYIAQETTMERLAASEPFLELNSESVTPVVVPLRASDQAFPSLRAEH
jgi:hypothetical protein